MSIQDPGSASQAQRATVQRTKNGCEHTPSWVSLALSARGDFGGEPRGSTPKSVYSILARPSRFPHIRLELALIATSRSVVLAFLVVFCTTIMAAFTSTISIPAAQLADAPQLEPAFEHLLRNSSVHESVIGTLRVNAITDRDTFVNMFDSEAALKEGA